MLNYFAENTWLFILLVAFFGLMIGSFLNVVIYRLPIMLKQIWHKECIETLRHDIELAIQTTHYNLAHPSSHCPFCYAPLSIWQKLPVISYLYLRGKCTTCHTHIPLRYLIVELLSVALSIGAAFVFGISFQLLTILIFTWLLIAITSIDFEHQILPDILVFPLLWLGLFFNCFNLFTNSRDAILGAIIGYTFFWLVSKTFTFITKKEGIGQGDFKLLAAIGAWVGWPILPFIVMVSSLLGLVVGGFFLLIRGKARQTPIPFGPFIAIAAWIGIIWGFDLTQAYLHLFGIQWSYV